MLRQFEDRHSTLLIRSGRFRLLISQVVKEEDLEKVDTRFADELGEDMRFNANDIQEKRKFEVKTNNVVINVKPEDSNIVKIKMIDGRKCLVIPMDNNVEINGIMSIIKEELEKNSEE